MVAIAIGPALFFFSKAGAETAWKNIGLIKLNFLTASFIVSLTYGHLFMIVWLLYSACFLAAWLHRRRLPSLVNNQSNWFSNLFRSNFITFMPLIGSGLFAAVVNIHSLQELRGVETGAIVFTDPYLGLFHLTLAPIYEEISYRLLPLGLTSFISLLLNRAAMRGLPLWKRVRLAASTFVVPDDVKARLGRISVRTDGLKKGISTVEWTAIIVTSAIFGFAHYLSGGGWEIGKVTTSSLSGFVFGTVFFAYGIYASILLHWFFNYYFTVFDLLSRMYVNPFAFLARTIEFLNLAAGNILVAFLGLMLLKRIVKAFRTYRTTGMVIP